MNNIAASSLAREIEELGPWFHNLHFQNQVQTAPNHFLGDFPRYKWNSIRNEIPDRLDGWTVLDIGCNAGFYSFELARRGAKVTGIDSDAHYLRQANWAARQYGLESYVRFEKRQVYDLARDPLKYDLVWFMGVLYHLRYPLLGLDIVARKTQKLLMLQTMTCPGEECADVPEDLPLCDRENMRQAGWPTMAFVEHRLERDPTNWWAPNHACVEAMLRSAGMQVVSRPAHEVYLCQPADTPQPHEDLLRAEYDAATYANLVATSSEELQ